MSPNPSKSRLVILDANIVIEAFRNNCWTAIVKNYRVILSRAVVRESIYYRDQAGQQVFINLTDLERRKELEVIEVPASEAKKFQDGFEPGYAERIHPGELESLCYLLNSAEPECRICSSDIIVYKIRGKLRRAYQGVSLEEMLSAIGVKRSLAFKYSKRFREQFSQEGLGDSLAG